MPHSGFESPPSGEGESQPVPRDPIGQWIEHVETLTEALQQGVIDEAQYYAEIEQAKETLNQVSHDQVRFYREFRPE